MIGSIRFLYLEFLEMIDGGKNNVLAFSLLPVSISVEIDNPRARVPVLGLGSISLIGILWG